MLKTKTMDRLCCGVMAAMLLASVLLWGCVASGQADGGHTIGYEALLFDQSRVHTLDILMDDWDSFIAGAAAEEYADCDIILDGERLNHVAIRAKGNTSLSSVAALGSSRYSFKVEFDHYVSGRTYHGLDKLSLNNLIQDATMMKDYLAYTLMNRMGVPSSLCSYVMISVGGEPWGLYLAVEGVEDAFLERNGLVGGELYKPDSMSFGGGRGNGRDFDMSQFSIGEDDQTDTLSGATATLPDQEDSGAFGGSSGMPQSLPDGNFAAFGGDGAASGFPGGNDAAAREERDFSDFSGFGGFSFGLGNDDVKLIYSDDDPDSYGNIFDNAKTDVSRADKERLVTSLRKLNAGEDIDGVVDTEEVIRYLTVHSFLCNDDSYTGMMVHNYYLYEKDGQLSIIPWDYNLAFGGFSASSDATSTVNSPIDSPVSGGTVASRPLIAWIFSDGEALSAYHALYGSFLAENIGNGWLAGEITRVQAMISPFLAEDPSAFYDMDAFEKAVDTLQTFCARRYESILGQLEGTIPSTSAGQQTNRAALVDASDLSTADMGSMNTGSSPGGFSMPDAGSFTPTDAGSFSPAGGGFTPSGAKGFTPSSGGSFSPPEAVNAFDPGDVTASSGGSAADAPGEGLSDAAGTQDARQTQPAVPDRAGGARASGTGAWVSVALWAAVLLAATLIIRRAAPHNA
ncbi:MAG: CotH kinase family protein [Aristaeellaceae bacterium]